MTPYIDGHIHLDCCDKEMQQALISHCRNHDMIVLAQSMDCEGLFNSPDIYAEANIFVGFGIHPKRIAEVGAYSSTFPELSQLTPAQWKDIHFFGEVGLDFHWVEDRRFDDLQRECFIRWIKASCEYGKSMQIHSKGAEKEILELLKKFRPPKPLIHWYSGSKELISHYLAIGCYFTIGPDVLIDGSVVAGGVPVDRILLESDAPYGISWVTGERESVYTIRRVYDRVSSIYDIPLIPFKDQIYENFQNWIK